MFSGLSGLDPQCGLRWVDSDHGNATQCNTTHPLGLEIERRLSTPAVLR